MPRKKSNISNGVTVHNIEGKGKDGKKFKKTAKWTEWRYC